MATLRLLSNFGGARAVEAADGDNSAIVLASGPPRGPVLVAAWGAAASPVSARSALVAKAPSWEGRRYCNRRERMLLPVCFCVCWFWKDWPVRFRFVW